MFQSHSVIIIIIFFFFNQFNYSHLGVDASINSVEFCFYFLLFSCLGLVFKAITFIIFRTTSASTALKYLSWLSLRSCQNGRTQGVLVSFSISIVLLNLLPWQQLRIYTKGGVELTLALLSPPHPTIDYSLKFLKLSS